VTEGVDVAIDTSTEALGSSISGGFGGGVTSTKVQIFAGVTPRVRMALYGGVALLVIGLTRLIYL